MRKQITGLTARGISQSVMQLAMHCALILIVTTAEGCNKGNVAVQEAGSEPAPSTAAPVACPDIVKLGKLTVGERKAFSFLIGNHHASHALRITSLHSGCGCASLEAAETLIAPGKHTTVDGVLIVPFKDGELSKHIEVGLDYQGSAFSAIVTLHGQVSHRIAVDPRDISILVDFTTNSNHIRRLGVQNNSEETVSFLGLAGVPEGMRVEFEPANLNPGQSGTLSIHLEPSFLCQATFNVTLYTSHSVERTIDLSVQIIPAKELRVSPSEIRLGVLSNAAWSSSKHIEVCFTGEGTGGLQLKQVSAPDFLQFVGHTVEKGRLVFRFLPNARVSTVLDGSIHFFLGRDGSTRAFKVTVPISGLLHDAS